MAAITSVIPRPTSYAGLWGWITTVDHKRIGVLYGVTAFIFLLFAGIEAGVIRMQLASADNDLIGPGRFNEMLTMHATTMVFMVIMPMSVSFFNIVIPLAFGHRRQRCCFPQTECPQLLDIPVRRRAHAYELRRRSSAGRRLVLVRQPHRKTFQR